MKWRSAAWLLALCSMACGRASCRPTPEKRIAAEAISTALLLQQTPHRPLLVLRDSDAWTDSPEGLPSLTVYEDGLAITAEFVGDRGDVDAMVGQVEHPLEWVRWVEERGFANYPLYTNVAGSTDQPTVTLSCRTGEQWRSVRVLGVHPDGHIQAKGGEPPPHFLEIHQALHHLPLRDVHPYVPTEFRVEFWDAEMSGSGPDEAWPTDVPPPPNLVPDERSLGRPRHYTATGEAGATLHRFVHGMPNGRPTVRTPSGERVAMWVHWMIPEQESIEQIEH
ncbi:hypothetical protein LVJ94_27400 [Pendulispora rubella]|uniref:Uncharacterized protein n=1 Tax=Pendulispora rubella TaxID=2741070 RepID=A0ABZ2KPP6_9BACT